MDNNFIVQLIARLDASKTPDDLKKIEQQLNNKGINLKATIDTATSKQELQNYASQLKKIFDSVGLNIDTSKILSSLNDAFKQIETISTKAGKIKLNFESDSYSSKVDSLIGKTNQWIDANGQARISTTSLQSALNNLNTAYANVTASGGNTEANQRALIEAEKALGLEIQSVTNKVNGMGATMAKSSAIDSLRQKYQAFYDSNSAAHRTWGAQLKAGIAELAPGAEISITKYKQLEQQLIQVGNAARQAGKLGKSWFDTLKAGAQKFSYWTSSTFLVTKAIQEIRQAVTFAKELDEALTNVNYTMDVTTSQLEKIGESSVQMSKQLGTSTSNVLSAVKLYANAKETADSIIAKAQPAIMISNVTGMTGEQSAKMLQSVMNQFDMTQEDLMRISDTIQAVSQNMAYDFAAGIQEIAGGIERSGSVARSAGLELEEYVSMLGLVIEQTGQSGDTIGNAFKTIFQRITKASATEGTLAEDISKAEESLRAVGVLVRDDANEFRDMTDIMTDLGKVWNTLSSVEQSNISYQVAGIRQTNILKSLLENWKEYEAMVGKASDSAGTTFETQEDYAKSLEGQLGTLSSTWDSAVHNLFDADSLKPFITGLTKLGEGFEWVTEKAGLLGTISLGAGLFAGIKNFGGHKILEPRKTIVLKLPNIISVLWDTKVFLWSNVKYTR